MRKFLLGLVYSHLLLFGSCSVFAFGGQAMLDELGMVYGDAAKARGVDLRNMLAALKNKSIQEKLSAVNDFFNSFQYRSDVEMWKKKDYWATPNEFIGRFGGDCEDYVIAKYFSLRYLGVPDKQLFLTYAKAKKQNVAHMVLNYFETPTSMPLVLDNYVAEVKSARERKDLRPLYSFNASSLFLSNPSAGLGKSLPTEKIRNSKWEKLLKEMRSQEQ